MNRAALLTLLVVAACACAPPPSAPERGPFTQLVILGDSIGTGFGVLPSEAFAQLLVRNDDQRHPDFAGRDLEHLAGEVRLVNLADRGVTTRELFDQLGRVPDNPSGRTLVVVSIGFNQFRVDLLAFFDSRLAWKEAEISADAVRRVSGFFADRARFPGGARIGLLPLLDPSDGTGRIPPFPQAYGLCLYFFALPNMFAYWPLFNERMRALSGEVGLDVTFVDAYAPFLGHGFHHADPELRHYHPDDPTLWFGDDCLHANARGNHELRRLIWSAIRPDEER